MTLVHDPYAELLIERARPFAPPRHVKVTGNAPAFGYEPCEDFGCAVGADGVASSCRRTACPNCGFGGTSVAMIGLLGGTDVRARCNSCGHGWTPGQKPVYVLTRAETVECTCPDVCERDHSNE